MGAVHSQFGFRGFSKLKLCIMERQLKCCGTAPGRSLAVLLVPQTRLFNALEANQAGSVSKK